MRRSSADVFYEEPFADALGKKEEEELDEQFFGDDAVIPSITIFSYEPAPPEDMGFFAPGYKKLENREQRKREKCSRPWKRLPLLPRMEVEGQKEDEEKEGDLECELQLSPMDVDIVLRNGIELTQDSSLATLTPAGSFLNISGSKKEVYTKTLNRNKKMALLNAKSLVSEAKAQETREALGQSVAKMPDEATQARHRLTHVPYVTWCKGCIEHRARPDRRERTDGVNRGSIPEVSSDFATQEQGIQEQSQREQYVG